MGIENKWWRGISTFRYVLTSWRKVTYRVSHQHAVAFLVIAGSLAHPVQASGQEATGDGTWADTGTGLMWQDDQASEDLFLRRDQALAYCESLRLAGHSDWRLPNIWEMLSTVDNLQAAHLPKLKDGFAKKDLKNVFHQYFWTASNEWGGVFSENGDPSYPVVFIYTSVFDNKLGRDLRWRVRCVRGPALNLSSLVDLEAAGKLTLHRQTLERYLEYPEYRNALASGSSGLRAFIEKYPDGYWTANAKAELKYMSRSGPSPLDWLLLLITK